MNTLPAEEKIAVGLPRGADTKYDYEWIESLFKMFGYSPCSYKLIPAQKVHHIARNEVVEGFLKTDMNYLLFIDSDMIWEPESLSQAYTMIQNEQVDIATGLYFTKNKPHIPVVRKLDKATGIFNIFVNWGNDPFEVDGAGMGFMLISRHVLEKMKQPLFEWKGGISEDLNFCLKVKNRHGFRIWVDPKIKLGHISQVVISSFDYVKQHKQSMEAWIREAMRSSEQKLRKEHPNWRKELGIHPLDFSNPNTAEYWDKTYTLEGTEDTWRTYPEKYEHIVKDLIKKDDAVVELGCGVGVFANALRKQYPETSYHGVDISGVAIQSLKRKGFSGQVASVPPINFYVSDDIIPGTKPLVTVALELLEHLDDEPRLQIIKEVSEVTQDKGRAIFSVPNDCMSPDEVTEHRIMFNKDTFHNFLKKAFKNVSVEIFLTRVSHKRSFGREQFLIAVCDNKNLAETTKIDATKITVKKKKEKK